MTETAATTFHNPQSAECAKTIRKTFVKPQIPINHCFFSEGLVCTSLPFILTYKLMGLTCPIGKSVKKLKMVRGGKEST